MTPCSYCHLTRPHCGEHTGWEHLPDPLADCADAYGAVWAAACVVMEIIHLDGGEMIHGLHELEDEGPLCISGLRPITSDGKDCPYFKPEEKS